MKKIFSLLLLLCVVFSGFVACGDKKTPETVVEKIDYVSQVTLDMNSETQKHEIENLSTISYIDGDTTHFRVPTDLVETGLLKARYIAVNTPESTGKIEEYGKKAASFTRSKLESASSVILETDSTTWDVDSTGDRYLVWVWYQTAGTDTYRNLNLELLQEGLAVGSKAGDTRYGSYCTQAINQAIQFKLHVHSGEKDPDFFYGAAHEIDLKELRLNIESYKGQRVAFEATVTYYSNQGVYVEDYDEETSRYFGIYIYYGFQYDKGTPELLAVGNRVRIVGSAQYYENGKSWQISDLHYDPRDKQNPDNIQLISKGNDAAHTLTTIETFYSDVEMEVGEEMKTLPYRDLALGTTIEMKSLVVDHASTTSTGGDNDGSITLYCKLGNREISVRTSKLYDENGDLVKQDIFEGKTIDVKGVVDFYYNDRDTADTSDDLVTYQIKVFSLNKIVIH